VTVLPTLFHPFSHHNLPEFAQKQLPFNGFQKICTFLGGLICIESRRRHNPYVEERHSFNSDEGRGTNDKPASKIEIGRSVKLDGCISPQVQVSLHEVSVFVLM
jgi:hypothetical protein